jgi:competence protein ComEC
VDQGDSALIQTPNGANILIDGGPKSSANKVISYLESLGINKINIVVSTHPHEDHIGGLISVLNNFTIDNVIDSGMPHTTTTYKNYLNAINSKNINYIVPTLGQEFDLDPNIKMQVLGPITKSTSNLNNSSIVIKLTYGTTSFLFAGDAQSKEESQILSKGYNLTSQVLKVGHHGSSSSSSINFLKAVSPSIAIISCGAGNSYGHPHDITLKNLKNLGVTIYRTDTTGDIIIQSDGGSCSVIQGSPFVYGSQSQETQDTQSSTNEQPAETTQQFVGSINSEVFHYPSCGYVKNIHSENIVWYSSYDDAISKGKRPCKVCNPTK